jgi:hypothetical protein
LNDRITILPERDILYPFDRLMNTLHILISHNHSFDLMSSNLFSWWVLQAKAPGQNGNPEWLFPFVQEVQTVF